MDIRNNKDKKSYGDFKKVVCRYHMMGQCKYGSSCSFSHDLNSIPEVTCQYYLNGECRYGDHCRFFHPPIQKSPEESTSKTKQLPPSFQKLSLKDNWIGASEFMPGKKYVPRCKTENDYSKVLKKNLPSVSEQFSETICPYNLEGNCSYGDSCQFGLHGLLCNICSMYVLHPTNEAERENHIKECMQHMEEDMKASFEAQKLSELQCGICLEKVVEKNDSKSKDQRFGILENCCHVYCLECIRKWRSNDEQDKKAVKGCPECRVYSSYVIPSDIWVEDKQEKEKLIEKYKNKMSQLPCKYFDEGRGQCQFGKHCFYLHKFADGTIQDKSKLKPPRHVYNLRGEEDTIEARGLAEFLNIDPDSDLILDLMNDHVDLEFFNEHDDFLWEDALGDVSFDDEYDYQDSDDYSGFFYSDISDY